MMRSQVYHVIIHHRGPTWQPGVTFQEQPGVEHHVRYFSEQEKAGKLLAGGPFIDSTGGMVIMDPSLGKDDVEAIANADPSVVAGLLRAEVHPWYQAMVAE